MTLELVQAHLSSLTPVLDLLQAQFKAERCTMSCDTWLDLCDHFMVQSWFDVPRTVQLKDDMPYMQVLCTPMTQFVTLELVKDA